MVITRPDVGPGGDSEANCDKNRTADVAVSESGTVIAKAADFKMLSKNAQVAVNEVESVRNLARVLSSERGMKSVLSPSPTELRPRSSDGLMFLPRAPTNLFGRNEILEDLLDLAERSASLTLLGSGGVGKTAVALTLLHHDRIAEKFGERRHFIHCDRLQKSLDSFLGCLSDATGAPPPRDMTQLRSHFKAFPPSILVLDGVDCILDPLAPEAAEITAAIEELARYPGLCLLATSRMDVRISGFRHMDVPTLPADVSWDVFHSHCGLGRSAAVDGLLAELDFHPLSITLLAGAASNNEWDETALLAAWEDGKTNILEAPGLQSLEYTIESVLLTPTLQELGSVIRETLEAIAAFPGGTKDVKLESTFPGIDGVWEAVNALCKFSLTYREDGFVKMLAPFRLHFLESQIYHRGRGPALSPAPDGVGYDRHDLVNPGSSPSFHLAATNGLHFLKDQQHLPLNSRKVTGGAQYGQLAYPC